MTHFVGTVVQAILSNLHIRFRSDSRYWPYSQFICP